MARDTSTTRLLYAILRQKCLEDVDWHKVARSQGITNGHAARMRYHRFKKQMKGPSLVRRPRNNNNGSRSFSSKKPKVKNSSTKSPRKIKVRTSSTPRMIKTEETREA